MPSRLRRADGAGNWQSGRRDDDEPADDQSHRYRLRLGVTDRASIPTAVFSVVTGRGARPKIADPAAFNIALRTSYGCLHDLLVPAHRPAPAEIGIRFRHRST
jgi:hypothetical protein